MGDRQDDHGLGVADFDYRAASALAIEHLIALGHRRIALVSGPVGLNSVTRVESGASAAVDQAPHGQDPADAHHVQAIGGQRAAIETETGHLARRFSVKPCYQMKGMIFFVRRL